MSDSKTTHRDMGPGFTHHDGACGCQFTTNPAAPEWHGQATWTCHRCDAVGFMPNLPTLCKEAGCPVAVVGGIPA